MANILFVQWLLNVIYPSTETTVRYEAAYDKFMKHEVGNSMAQHEKSNLSTA